jgi:hypothetical protein
MNSSIVFLQRSVFSSRGGVAVRVLVVVFTLTILGGAIYLLLRQVDQKQQVDQRNALAISEYGLMAALQQLHENPSKTADIPKTPYNEGWYSVTMRTHSLGDTLFLTLSSRGKSGTVTERREYTLRRAITESDTVWVRERMQ